MSAFTAAELQSVSGIEPGARVKVAALFTTVRTPYLDLGCDCYDIHRDARTYTGWAPVVAHPPCRAWGRLSHFAKPRPDEMDLAHVAVAQVRRCGGVLEHPSASRLWKSPALGRWQLPAIGTCERDAWGGFSLAINQSWWGHRAPKRTWLYIVGIEPRELPDMPFHLGEAAGRVCEGMSAHERMATPPAMAAWLVDLAQRCAQ